MAIEVPNTHAFRDPPFAEAEVRKYFGEWLDVGEEMVAYGSDLEAAYGKMETLEHFAKINLIARLIGEPARANAAIISMSVGARVRSRPVRNRR